MSAAHPRRKKPPTSVLGSSLRFFPLFSSSPRSTAPVRLHLHPAMALRAPTPPAHESLPPRRALQFFCAHLNPHQRPPSINLSCPIFSHRQAAQDPNPTPISIVEIPSGSSKIWHPSAHPSCYQQPQGQVRRLANSGGLPRQHLQFMPEEEVAPRSCARMNHSDSKKRRSRSNRDASASLPPIAGGSPGAQGAPNAGLAAGGAPRATLASDCSRPCVL